MIGSRASAAVTLTLQSCDVSSLAFRRDHWSILSCVCGRCPPSDDSAPPDVPSVGGIQVPVQPEA